MSRYLQSELDFSAVPWIAPSATGTSLGRQVLNTRIADMFAKWLPAIERNGGHLPVGLFDDMAQVLEGYARVAVREALAARRDVA